MLVWARPNEKHVMEIYQMCLTFEPLGVKCTPVCMMHKRKSLILSHKLTFISILRSFTLVKSLGL